MGAAVLDTKQRAVATAIPRSVGLRKPDMRRQHREADVLPDVALFVEDGWAQPVEAKTATALPASGFRNAALFAVDDLLQARRAVGVGMLAHFDANVSAAHLVSDGGGCAGSEEGIKHEVVRIGCNVDDALN